MMDRRDDRRKRGFQEDSSFESERQILRGAELHVANGLGLLDEVVHADLRAVVGTGPDRHRYVAAQESVRGMSVTERHELRQESVFLAWISRQAFELARYDRVGRDEAE